MPNYSNPNHRTEGELIGNYIHLLIHYIEVLADIDKNYSKDEKHLKEEAIKYIAECTKDIKKEFSL